MISGRFTHDIGSIFRMLWNDGGTTRHTNIFLTGKENPGPAVPGLFFPDSSGFHLCAG